MTTPSAQMEPLSLPARSASVVAPSPQTAREFKVMLMGGLNRAICWAETRKGSFTVSSKMRILVNINLI